MLINGARGLVAGIVGITLFVGLGSTAKAATPDDSSLQAFSLQVSPRLESPVPTALGWLVRHLNAEGDAKCGTVRFTPFPRWISPYLVLHGGSLFEVDADRVASLLGLEDAPTERLGYDFGDAHAGIQVVRRNRYRFLIRGGLSILVSKPDAFAPCAIHKQAFGAVRAQSHAYVGASGRIILQIFI